MTPQAGASSATSRRRNAAFRSTDSSSVTGAPYQSASGRPGEPLPLPTSITSGGSDSPSSGTAASESSTSSRRTAAASRSAVTDDGSASTARQ